MINLATLLVAALSGVFYFIFEEFYITLIGLLLITLLTRFNAKTMHFGKFVEILFVFYLITYIVDGFKITYPGSLILILTFLVVIIFVEGPEWGQLYFSAGDTGAYLKLSLIFAAIFLILFGGTIYLNFAEIANPVPVRAPMDALIIMGIGLAFYLSAMEEIIFRSFFFERAKSVASSGMAVIVQGLVFGGMLYEVGVPSGIPGLVLGTLFGLGLGYLVYKSGSIYPSMLAHFIVTLGIFTELAILGKAALP